MSHSPRYTKITLRVSEQQQPQPNAGASHIWADTPQPPTSLNPALLHSNASNLNSTQNNSQHTLDDMTRSTRNGVGSGSVTSGGGRPTRSTRRTSASFDEGEFDSTPAKNGRGGKKKRGAVDDSEEDEYQGGGDDDEDEDAEGEVDDDDDDFGASEKVTRSRGRAKAAAKDEDDDGDFDMDDGKDEGPAVKRKGGRAKVADSEEEDEAAYEEKPRVATTTRSGRSTSRPQAYQSEDDSDDAPARKSKLVRGNARGKKESEYEDDEEFHANEAKRQQRKRDHDFEVSNDDPETSEDGSVLDLNDDDSNDEILREARLNQPRALRQKNKVDYFKPLNIDAVEGKGGKSKKGKSRDGNPFNGLPLNMTGAMYASLYPDKGARSDSSDDDGPSFQTPRKGGPFGGQAGFGGMGGGMLSGGGPMNIAGGPGTGKINNAAALADADPLGVPSNVSFDSVGGMGAHIQQLKEMVSLPLLYPEVFERFKITPPRGVLFHGPPGTGKTLLARALAASCSTDGRKISFFMRKGADCLSKWVGEAERQLRLLFDEAKACQPSIIFFDEIDGLAPVRSAKQDQIHASIVSTMLALMDGMDGRGQVIVIGATNRPDAIDPALRRPGRFDREFYFPLPNLEARRKILDIHTMGWEPPLASEFKDELADLTKGYGGADLRALCTEAALNAVQRTYPQIYKTNDRLVIHPEKIDVTARDFVISQKNMIPSTARSTSSSAAPLPPQLEPLLADALKEAELALKKVLPEVKKANVLEEAEWEDDGGGFEKEKMLNAFETLRVFRPRMMICGEPGMGQSYIGAAVLQHLEGFHVQNLDLATLVADSSRSMEAACVQLFIEAKRHKPSILFIPALVTWSFSVTETVRATIKGLLDGLDPSDPILLLAIVDGPVTDLPGDVRSWFGFVKGNRVIMKKSTALQRSGFFKDVLAGIARPPDKFPDAIPRRKRVLEQLAIAPPPPPRVPTEAELAAQRENDQRVLEHLKFHLSAIHADVKKRFRRFCRSYNSDWERDDLERRQLELANEKPVVGWGDQPYYHADLDTMQNDILKGNYLTPQEFLDDVLRVQANAEINALLENDAEGSMRAAQMTNVVKVMIDHNFDAATQHEYAKVSARIDEKEAALSEEDKAKLAKTRRKRKVDVDLSPAAIRARAVKGGMRIAYPEKCTPEELNPATAPEEAEADADAVAGSSGALKRAAEAEGDAAQLNGDEHGPSKRAKQDEALPASNGLAAPLVNGLGSGISPSLAPVGVASPFAGLGEDAATVAALGASEVAGGLLAPLATHPSVSPTTLIAPLQPSVHFSPEVAVSTLSAPLSSATAVSEPTLAEDSQPIAREPTPLPEPHADFFLPQQSFASLGQFLVEATGELNIDQLEQLRAASYDLIWRGRKEWNRTEMVAEIGEMAREFVEEVRDAIEAERKEKEKAEKVMAMEY